MKNRNEKQQDLDKLKTELAKVSTVILSTFQGITVEDDTKLRRAVQAAGGKYKVVKNTLAERAGAGTPAENLLKNLSGTNSIAYTAARSEEHTSELQSQSNLVCRLLLEK